MRALLAVIVAGLTAAGAYAQPIPWTLEDRVKKTEDRLDKLEWRLKQVEGNKVTSAPPEAPRSKRVLVNGLWYDQLENGTMVPCEECNAGKVVSWKAGAVYVPPGMNPNFRGTMVPYYGEPIYKREEVPQGSPFGGAGLSSTPTTSVTGAVLCSTSYQGGMVGGGTPIRVAGVGRPGIISRMFRGGGCTTGGCP